jgi:inositol transport system substrate-binding protein
MKRILTIPVCILTCCLAFPIPKAEAKTEKLILNVPNMAFPFFVFMRGAASNEAKKLNVDLIVQDGQGSSSKQSSDLRNAVTQGVDGIVLVPNDVNALVPVVNEVVQSNIPLITVDRSVSGTVKPVSHVGADNVAGGRAQGKWVVEKFPNGAKIIFLRGEPGASPAIDRAKGFYEVIKAAGDKYKVVADQTGNFARSQGMQVTQNLLTSLGAPPDLIVCSNDDMALGAIAALKQSGVSKGKVPVIGYDALPEALRAIREGEMAATVEQSPGKQVQTALDQLVDNIRNKQPLQNVSIEPFVVDNTNLDKAERFEEAK